MTIYTFLQYIIVDIQYYFIRAEYFKMEVTIIISALCLVILPKDTKFENLSDVNIFLCRTISF